MTTFTISAKGQITLTKNILTASGLRPGEKVSAEYLDGGLLLRPTRRTTTWEDSVAMLRREGEPILTIEEMNEVIAKGWAGEL
ncbi:MAG: AbrB/MazE/SpoVT family DNA-binding domain-containing protein [Cellulomonadaceae bacterium]|jgi:antitoxin component of MazEF toxin-antitoxin module|nr:AbrB/MazE/SpoVT family DNA-binding domain-containing protein [Cellulomonadaceae bacterium]